MRDLCCFHSLDAGHNVYQPALASQGLRVVTNALASALLDSLGGSKSCEITLSSIMQLLWAQAVIVDLKNERGADGKKPCQKFPMKSISSLLTSDEKNKDLPLTLILIMKNPKDSNHWLADIQHSPYRDFLS